MIYNHVNATGARVYDVEALEELKAVLSIDTDTGDVVCASQPVRLNAAGNAVEAFAVKFDTIYPIQGMEPRPALFHCYGRKH